MRCVVTAGPTFEPLDEVRRLTNFSTGRLGSELVNFLCSYGHEVTLLIGQQATWRGERRAHHVETFTTSGDLRQKLHALAGQGIEAVFHAAAVGDFAFGKVWRRSSEGELRELHFGKIPSREGTLLAELVPTPKIISELRDWFPKARLVGWKYEVDGEQPDAIRRAREQILASRTDACVANGPAYGDGFGLITNDRTKHLADVETLFACLELLLRSAVR